MVNAWIEFCKEYAQKHKISYGCAVFDPRCKEDYRKLYPKGESSSKTKISKPKKTLEQRIKKRVEKIQMSGSKPFTANQKSIKERLESRILKNRGDRGL